MRAKRVYEFKKTGDIKTSLGIGYSKEYLLSEIKAGKNVSKFVKDKSKRAIWQMVDWMAPQIDEDYVDDTILSIFPESAVDMYLPSDEKIELFLLWALLGKKAIKIKSYSLEGYEEDREEDRARIDLGIQELQESGWDLAWKEDNFDVIEIILVKYDE